MEDIIHRVRMTQQKIDRYGVLNGDNDIIHYDHHYAVERGFRGTLAHGPHNMAPAAELCARKFGRDWFTRGRLFVKWIGPVCPGDEQITTLHQDGSIEASVAVGTVMIGCAELRDGSD